MDGEAFDGRVLLRDVETKYAQGRFVRRDVSHSEVVIDRFAALLIFGAVEVYRGVVGTWSLEISASAKIVITMDGPLKRYL